MDFKCVIRHKDFVRITDENAEVRIEIRSDEPIVYISKKDLSKLIKHLQSMEENK